MLCGLLYDILSFFVLNYLLFAMRAVVLYVGSCVICGMLYGMWALV